MSVESRAILKKTLSEYIDKVSVLEDLTGLQSASFDYLLAFDVIEHIEHDFKTLLKWSGLLKNKGKVLLSVPAHKNKFGKSDEMMGHYRRYEKEDVVRLLEQAGFSDICIFSYGFPLINITTPVINALYSLNRSRIKDYDLLTQNEKTQKSGFLMPKLAQKLLFPFNRFTMFPFKFLQRIFFKNDIGVEYLAFGTKVG